MARSKLPWYKHFPGDWLNEPSVRRLSLAARGAWIDLLDLMYLEASDRVRGTPAELARMLGCSPDEAWSVITELARAGTCDVTPDVTDVTLSDGIVTLRSRRLARELKEREQTRLRVQAHRARKACNAPVSGEKSEVRSQKSEVRRQKEEEDLRVPAPPTGGASGDGGPPPQPGPELFEDAGLPPNGPEAPGPKPPPWRPSHDYVAEWNFIASQLGARPIRNITTARRRHLKAREAEGFGDAWPTMVKNLKGSTDWTKGWGRLTFDWLIEKDSNWPKVAEGKYLDKKPKGGGGSLSGMDYEAGGEDD